MTVADAKAAFESFKSAKADASQTNQQVVTAYNKLYEKARQLKLAGEAQKKAEELVAENTRLKALVEGKKAVGKSA